MRFAGLFLATLMAIGCGVDEPPKLELPDRTSATTTPSPAAPSTATAPSTTSSSETASSETVKASSPARSSETGIRVETLVVAPQRIFDEVVFTGELRAAESVTVRAETSGRAVSLHFTEGQAIQRGDLMVKINDAELAAERKRTTLRRDLAAQREQRLGALVGEGTISQDLYDEARNELAVLDAELELYDARIAETEVRAPFDGVVGLREISVGSYLTPQVGIATLQALDPMKIDVAAAERHASRFRPGDHLTFTVAGIERSFHARVYAIEPRIDAETRTLQIRADAPNPGRVLLPGAFAKVRVELDAQDDALLVPSIALVPGLEATTVFVVEDGLAATREVETGRRTHSEIEIVNGLAPGDEVIISGIQRVRPGTPVLAGASATGGPSDNASDADMTPVIAGSH